MKQTSFLVVIDITTNTKLTAATIGVAISDC